MGLSWLGAGEFQRVIDDWKYLVDSMKISRDPNDKAYLHHNGRLVVTIWGIGFNDRLNLATKGNSPATTTLSRLRFHKLELAPNQELITCVKTICSTNPGSPMFIECVDYPKLAWQFIPGDSDNDKDVDFVDFARMGLKWLRADSNLYCGGMDLTDDG